MIKLLSKCCSLLFKYVFSSDIYICYMFMIIKNILVWILIKELSINFDNFLIWIFIEKLIKENKELWGKLLLKKIIEKFYNLKLVICLFVW